jgi:G patch domain-containing protein 1
MSQKDRERLQRAASSVSGSVNPEAAAPSSSISWPPSSLPAAIHIPRLEPFIAKAALQGFQPFLNDPVKHERYTIYLNSQSHADGSYPPLQPYPGQKIDAFNKEVSDFAKAGAVFKPLSAAMAGRFTSAAAVENGPVAQEGLYQPTFKEEDEAAAKEDEKKAEEKVEDNPQTNAARAGMYGPMTRTVTKWTPAKLLCKRFGVKDPNPEPDPEDEVQSNPTSTPAPPVAVAAITLPEARTGESTAYVDASEMKRPTGPRDLASVGLGEDEYQAQDVLTYERPSMDVFKAIFASDDEDSDDELASAAETKLVPVGPHLAAVDPAASTKASANNPLQEERQSANVARVAPESGPVDLSSFKPTFVPRGDREARKDDAGRASDRKKKDKKAVVSFDAEDVDDSGLGAPKAKKRKEKQKGKDREKKAHQLAAPTNEDDMWVEKPPPEAVKKMLAPTSGVPLQPERMKPKGRQTAADLM